MYGCGLTKGKHHNTERIYTPIKLEDISDLECLDVWAGDGSNLVIDTKGMPYKWDGVTGKYEIVEEVGGKYVSQVVLGNKNVVILA